MRIVAAVGVLINGATALLFMSGRHHDLNVRGAFLHMAADAAVSLGVVVAGMVIAATGWFALDPVVSLLIAAAIVWGTWGLLKESLHLAMDAVPRGIDLESVEECLRSAPGVIAVHDLHVWAMSTTETALTVHLVRPDATADDALLQAIAVDLRARFGIGHTTIQLECAGGNCCQEAPDVV